MNTKRVKNQIKRGLRAIRNGEFWRISRHWWIQTETPVIIDTCSLPSQVAANTGSAEVLRIGNEYRMGISDQRNCASIVLTPDEPATIVEFELINNLQRVNQLEVNFKFKLTNGTTKQDSFVFTDGDFNDIRLLPVEIVTDDPFTEVTIELHTDFKKSKFSWKGRIDAALNRLTTPIQAQTGRNPLLGIPRARGQTDNTNPPIFYFQSIPSATITSIISVL